MKIINVTSENFSKSVEKSNIVIVPIGSLEAHGKHLPLGTDIFSPRMICEGLDKKIGEKIWIAPEIPYGQSDYLAQYPGTVTIPSEVMAEYLYYVGKSLFNNGLTKIILMNGHGGNITALKLAAEKLARIDATVVIVNWWLDYSNEILNITETQGHAGEDETSAMLYYDEKLVEMNNLNINLYKPLYNVYFKDRGSVVLKNAITGNPTLASKEKGEKIFNILEDKLVDLIEYLTNEKYLNN